MEQVGGEHQRPRIGKYAKISQEQNDIFAGLIKAGRHLVPEAANEAKIPLWNAYRISKAVRENGSYTRKPKGGSKSKLSSEHLAFLKSKIDEYPPITIKALREALVTEYGADSIDVCPSTVANAVAGFHCTLIILTSISERGDSREAWAQRVEFTNWFVCCERMSGKVVFVDESGCKLGSHRRLGRSLRSKQCKFKQHATKSKNSTTTAAITSNGLLDFKILEGTCDASKYNPCQKFSTFNNFIYFSLELGLVSGYLSKH